MSLATMTIADSSLAAEMWISLRSLLTSHVSMHSIAQPGDGWSVRATNANTMTIQNRRGTLRWTAPDASGAGTWHISATNPGGYTAHGRYEFTGEGLLRFDEEEESLELEAAVERRLHPLQGTESRA